MEGFFINSRNLYFEKKIQLIHAVFQNSKIPALFQSEKYRSGKNQRQKKPE